MRAIPMKGLPLRWSSNSRQSRLLSVLGLVGAWKNVPTHALLVHTILQDDVAEGVDPYNEFTDADIEGVLSEVATSGAADP